MPSTARAMAIARPDRTIAVSEAATLPVVAPRAPLVRPAPPLLSPVPVNGGYLRRCTFRRMELLQSVTRRTEPVYAVTCLYPDRESARPLGDLASARAICDGCAATGIFRPDED